MYHHMDVCVFHLQHTTLLLAVNVQPYTIMCVIHLIDCLENSAMEHYHTHHDGYIVTELKPRKNNCLHLLIQLYSWSVVL